MHKGRVGASLASPLFVWSGHQSFLRTTPWRNWVEVENIGVSFWAADIRHIDPVWQPQLHAGDKLRLYLSLICNERSRRHKTHCFPEVSVNKCFVIRPVSNSKKTKILIYRSEYNEKMPKKSSAFKIVQRPHLHVMAHVILFVISRSITTELFN